MTGSASTSVCEGSPPSFSTASHDLHGAYAMNEPTRQSEPNTFGHQRAPQQQGIHAIDT